MASAPLDHRNRRTGVMMALVALAMIGLGFASVPLYRMFCQVTGFGGTTMRVASDADVPGEVVGTLINVRFDTNVAPGLPWTFKAEKHVQRTALGARYLAFFTATNESDKPITGTATFNVTPTQAGQYFAKIQCFCFTEQTLQPGETIRMPVSFFVDPELAKNPDTSDISEITLSYTFFPVDSKKTAS